MDHGQRKAMRRKIMARMRLGHKSLAGILSAGLLLAWSGSVRGEESLRDRILEINKITGLKTVRGEIVALSADLMEARKLMREAETLVREKKQSLSYNAALALAEAASQVKDLKLAEFFFRICIDHAVKLKSTTKISQSYGGLINSFYENKKYAESARACRELIELKADDGKPREYVRTVGDRTAWGDVNLMEDENFDPVQELRTDTHMLLIKSVAKQGKYDEAMKMVDTLVKTRDHWLFRALRGWVQREAGHFAEAAQTYEDVIARVGKDRKIDPEDRDSYQERYRYILSNIYVDTNQIDKASEILQSLMEKNPSDPGFPNDLGYIWADHDLKLPEAEKLIRKALELDRKRRAGTPDADRGNGAYLDSLGWVLYKQKKFKEAKEVMLKAIEDKNAQHIEIYDHLGDIHLALGEREAAVAAWRKGLEVGGDSRRDQQRRAEVERKIKMHSK
jgi:tetratricopeptide (TPR) repeat protein